MMYGSGWGAVGKKAVCSAALTSLAVPPARGHQKER